MKTRTPMKSANTIKNVCAIIFLSFFFASPSRAEQFTVPEGFINFCILSSAADDIRAMTSPTKLALEIITQFQNGNLTPEDCRHAAVAAEIALNRYMFRKDLGNCLPLSELAGRTTV